mgnify:FL=1
MLSKNSLFQVFFQENKARNGKKTQNALLYITMQQKMAHMARYTEGSIVKSLVALSVPIVLSNILQTAYQLIDTFWVGRLGAGAVAAVSVSFPLVFLIIALGGGLAIAGSIFIAQYAGARDAKMVNHVSAQTLLMVVSVSLVLAGIGYAFAPGILRLMGIGSDIFADALVFLRVSFLSITFVFGFSVFQSVLRGVGEVRLPLYIVGATVLLNFFLDPILIFGWGPIAAHGVAGAAWATLITEALSMCIGFYILTTGKYGIKLHARDFTPDWPLIKRAFFMGLPASIEQSSRALGFTIITFLVTAFGTTALAVYGIGIRVLTFIIIPALGLAMATSTLVGQNIGAGNIKRADAISKLGAWVAFSVLTFLGLLSFIFAPTLVHFFVPNDPQVLSACVLFIRIMSPMYGLIGAQMVLTGTFRAAGETKVAMNLTLLVQWLFQIPLVYVFSHHTKLGLEGIWWSFPATNIVGMIATLWWYQRGTWKHKTLTKEAVLQEEVTEEIIIEEGIKP